jgi:hypothetical protein
MHEATTGDGVDSRVRVLSDVPLPTPAEAERRVLEQLGVDSLSVRLACQLRPIHDLAVWPLVPPAASTAFLQRGVHVRGHARLHTACGGATTV